MNSTRLGLYETVDQLKWTQYSENSSRSTMLCVFWGAVAGVAGSTVGCPLYMVKTQLQAQSHGKIAVGFQHGHSGMTDALLSTYKQQGLHGLWRGIEGIVPRTAVGSAIQMTTFSKSKELLCNYEVDTTESEIEDCKYWHTITNTNFFRSYFNCRHLKNILS